MVKFVGSAHMKAVSGFSVFYRKKSGVSVMEINSMADDLYGEKQPAYEDFGCELSAEER